MNQKTAGRKASREFAKNMKQQHSVHELQGKQCPRQQTTPSNNIRVTCINSARQWTAVFRAYSAQPLLYTASPPPRKNEYVVEAVAWEDLY